MQYGGLRWRSGYGLSGNRKKIGKTKSHIKKQWRKKPLRNNVTVHRFRVQRSAPPLTAEAASLIEKETPALRSHIRGLGTRTKLKTRSSRKKCRFCQTIANAPPILRLGMTKPGATHINTPPKWTPGTRMEP